MLLGAEALARQPLHHGDGLGLEVIAAQDQVRHLAGHPGQQLPARLFVQRPVTHGLVQQDLDVDLVVGAVDAGRVVDEIRVEPPAGVGVLDAPELGQAQVAALPHDLAAQFRAVHAQGVVRMIADVRIALLRRFYIGADPAVPQQVRLGPEQFTDEFVRGQLLRVHAQPLADLGAQRDGLVLPRVNPAAFRDQRGVVVRPVRARQFEKPLALGERHGRVGIGVEEDVQVVERGQQPDLLREQHAVAEHVARHVADADHGERLFLDVHAQFAEMALDALPGALGGDAHALVVVADRAAGGERVAQPEAALQCQRIGRVGEGRRSLVSRDHQVGVVPVAADHVGGRDQFLDIQVVSDVQKAPYEALVAVGDFRPHGVAVTAPGQLLDHESALGADRHDHGVLDVLRLHQAQHLGAEILLAVRPAQPAARHRAHAQVDAFNPR